MSARSYLSMFWTLPPHPLRRRAILAFGLLTLATAQIAGVLSHPLGTTADYPSKATAIFAAAAGIALGRIKGHHPFDSLGPAIGITGIRMVMTSLVAGLIGERPAEAQAEAAVVLTVMIAVLDGVDGWLARRTKLASAFGARFDMETDAFLIFALAVLAWQYGKAGVWIVLAGVMRYVFVAAGYVWRWMDAPLPPSTRRKAICVVQIVGLGAVVSPLLAAPASVAAAAVTLVALAWSFGVDVLWLWRHRA